STPRYLSGTTVRDHGATGDLEQLVGPGPASPRTQTDPEDARRLTEPETGKYQGGTAPRRAGRHRNGCAPACRGGRPRSARAARSGRGVERRNRLQARRRGRRDRRRAQRASAQVQVGSFTEADRQPEVV